MLLDLLFLLFLPLPSVVVVVGAAHNLRPVCGGRLTAAHGVLATPNFPRRFPTPIRCQWAIDARHVQAASPRRRVSIKIYLTQLYVHEGLTFTEYDSFDAYDYGKLMGGSGGGTGAVAFRLAEDDVTSNKTHVVVDKEYLIVDFQLERLESTHLRVLDGLLDVFGFNITYEISTGPPREDRCTMKFCGFTGYCYDDFTHFRCDCFPGFSGRHCSEGPLSKCTVNGQPMCENGAECRHTGHTAYVCDCKPGFEGTFCERRKADIPTTGCDSNDPTCLISCPFNGTMEDVCQCDFGSSKKFLSAINESIGYSSRIFVQSALGEKYLAATLKRNIYDLLKVNVTKVEDINIILFNTVNNESDVTLRFYAPKQQDVLIRSTIRRWGRQQYGRTDNNYTLTERDIVVKTEPYLYLDIVAVDKSGSICEGEEFVLSCTARGSPLMRFRWFMDDVLVNLTSATKNKWETLISRGQNTDHYTALLGFRGANRFDHGRYTCQVEDYGIQQCRSLHVDIVHQPSIQLEPASLTVEKGQPFTIKCLSMAKFGEKYKFSWTKDKYLLPIKTDFEHYEVLYPSGSILQVARLNKTTTYSCLAHLDKLSAESSIVVYVVDKHVVRPCPAERIAEATWPETAAGGDCRLPCPMGYFGETVRACIMMENGQPRWLPPDHSNCTHDDLMEYLRDFRYLEEGYAKTTPLETLARIRTYIASHGSFLRGEGRVVLHFLERIAGFNNASHGYSDHVRVTDLLLEIVDGILAQNVSLNKEQQVVTLQKLVHSQLMILSAHIIEPYVKILTNLEVSIKIDKYSINPACLIQVTYHNLYAFLTKKSVIRLSYGDDREMIYDLISDVTSIWRWENEIHQVQPNERKVLATFEPLPRISSPEGVDFLQTENKKGALRCFLAEYAASDYVWDASKCHLVHVDRNASTKMRCECDTPGTMALLLVESSDPHSADLHRTVRDDVVITGCAVCLVLSVLAGILLSISWCRHKSTMTFLRGQCAASIAGCMVLFLVGFTDVIAKRFYLNVLSCLLICYLSALASQLSALLIIYTELIDMQTISSMKPTVVGIVSGAPAIAVFANHLTHNIKDIPLAHWWIVRNTLAFYVFIVCVAIISVLYVIVCCLVSKLLKFDKTKSDKLLKNRSLIMTKSTLIFMAVAISAGTSVACVNFPEELMWRYTFAATTIFMGVVTLVCLVLNVHSLSLKRVLEKFHHNRPEQKHHTAKGAKTKDTKHHVSHNKCASTKGVDLPALQSPEIEEYPASPTQYMPASGAPLGNATSLNSPDILGTKVFAELDLVASSRQSELPEAIGDEVRPPQTASSQQPPSSPGRKSTTASNVIIANSWTQQQGSELNDALSAAGSSAVDKCIINASPVVALGKFTKPDKCVTFCDKIEYDSCAVMSPIGDAKIVNDNDVVIDDKIAAVDGAAASAANPANLNDVMDGICNDLKYLLNGHQFTDPISSISC